MPNQITALSATTELEAVNTMLSAIASAPIADVTAGLAQTDVSIAVNLLRNATREVQSMPWQFNTRFQVPISPAVNSPLAWTDPDGTVRSLNVFKAPTNLGSFTVSNIPANMKTGRVLDIALQISTLYQESAANVVVFFDRTFNRDGFIVADFPKLYLDITYLFDFVQIPESARRYIVVLATRRFIAATVGAAEIAGFTLEDEKIALRNLKRDQGDDDTHNMLDNPDVSRVLGYRARIGGSFVDYRRGSLG